MSEALLASVAWRPPKLESSRLLLRGYEPSDASAISAYASDEETTRYMAWNTHTSPDEALAFLDDWVAENYREAALDYAICKKNDPTRVIGGIGVYAKQHNTAELGYILHRDHWGQGFIVEAARLLINHVFSTTRVVRIQAPVFADNTRSRRAAEKIGMTLEGVLRSTRHLRGRRWDEAIYAVLKEDWISSTERDVRSRA